MNFNPRSRTGSDRLVCASLDGRKKFQPTLPHRERRGRHPGAPEHDAISTHAPAQGATQMADELQEVYPISTHAPAQGATKSILNRFCTIQNFNPRSRTGSDPHRDFCGGGIRYFNPRSRTGSDGKNSRYLNAKGISTHAPAQGATTRPGTGHGRLSDFNPRSRTGSDRSQGAISRYRDISTHAPAQGATGCQSNPATGQGISTHAPAQGATDKHPQHWLEYNSFQPTLPHRERRRGTGL